MNTQDLGIYLMVWLVSSVLVWILIGDDLSVKAKIIIPIIMTVFMVLFRIAIYLMTGE